MGAVHCSAETLSEFSKTLQKTSKKELELLNVSLEDNNIFSFPLSFINMIRRDCTYLPLKLL